MRRAAHLWSGWGNVSLIHWKNCGPKAVLDLRTQQSWQSVRVRNSEFLKFWYLLTVLQVGMHLLAEHEHSHRACEHQVSRHPDIAIIEI